MQCIRMTGRTHTGRHTLRKDVNFVWPNMHAFHDLFYVVLPCHTTLNGDPVPPQFPPI